jgi:hypothetical protein
MSRELRRQAPALVVACIALVAALGGTVYAGTKRAKRVDGKTVKVKSLPGNRLKLGSVPGNRLKAGAIQGASLAPGSVTGLQVDVATLGQVPSAVHADNADSARDAETALNAVNAIDAVKVNGHTAGCTTETRFFAGACWEKSSKQVAVSAPAAATSCATNCGELPSALALVAFGYQPGINLNILGEWTADIPVVSGADKFAVVTVSQDKVINSELPTGARSYRCVLPLLR